MAGLIAVQPASAAAAGCGQVITTSVTLSANVGPCPGDGITIGANNITLDLGGHTVTGARTRLPSGDAAGIRLSGRSGVTVRRGTVTGFDAGVVVSGGSANSITGLSVQDNVSSANMGPPDPFGTPTFTANLGDGIAVINSARNSIVRNVVRANGIYDNISVLGAGSDDNTVQSNAVTGAPGAGLTGLNTVGMGILLDAAVDSPVQSRTSLYRNKVLSNIIERNANSGIFNSSNVNGVIYGNTVRSNGFAGNNQNSAVYLSADPGLDHTTNMLVQKNLVIGNSFIGIDTSAVDTRPTGGNKILDNTVARNGYYADGHQPEGGGIGAGTSAVVQGNTVIGNIGTGVDAGPGQDNLIADNTVTDNIHEGIVLAGTSNNYVLRNRVHRNTQSGIGVIFSHGAKPNVIRDNDASDNMAAPTFWANFYLPPYTLGADLIDISENAVLNDPPVFDCGTDIWFGNKWGSGGYFPPCVTAGGSGPPNRMRPSAPQGSAAAQQAGPAGKPELRPPQPQPRPHLQRHPAGR